MAPSPSSFWIKLGGLLLAFLGLLFLSGGIWNLALGGPAVYLLAGIPLTAAGILLFRLNPAGLALYAATFLGVLLWALLSCGLDLWALVPRLDLFLGIGIALLLPILWKPLFPSRAALWPLAVVTAGSALALVAACFTDPVNLDGALPVKIVNSAPVDPEKVPPGEWRDYARTQQGNHYSPLDQINTANVSRLRPVWTMQTGDMPGAGDPAEATNEATPLMVGNKLYFCSLHQKLFAVNGETGKTEWVFDPHLHHDATFQHLTCRGVSYHEMPANAVDSDGNPVPHECHKRIFLPTNDGRLIAVDADSGKKCRAFGNDGEVDLRFAYQPNTKMGDFEPTSPPVVTDKVVIANGAVTDNYSTDQASGATRAYDLYTGKLKWVFDAANADPNEMPGPDHPRFHPNSPNSWSISAYDRARDLIFMPMGIGTPDQWGGDRSEAFERYAPGIIALHGSTGKLAWYRQTVHHDLWDMDVPSQPALMDIHKKDGSVVPAIYVPTKAGDIFVFNRDTGETLVPIKELPAPRGAVKGDWVSETQPASALSARAAHRLTDSAIWGGTLLDQMICSAYFHQLRYEGPFTPPSLQGTLVYPGNLGVFEWGGIAVDPTRQVAFASILRMPFVSTLLPRGKGNPLWPSHGEISGKKGNEMGIQHNYGAPFAVNIAPFMNPWLMKIGFKVPCKEPPWGENIGIDLNANKIVWSHRSGTIRDSLYGAPVPLQLPPARIGVPTLGGAVTTAGGLSFVSGSQDNYIRAYDLTTGKRLWQQRLPAGGQSTPMTYAIKGRQYIATYAGGHGSFGSKMGDYLIAYALPDKASGESPAKS